MKIDGENFLGLPTILSSVNVEEVITELDFHFLVVGPTMKINKTKLITNVPNNTNVIVNRQQLY